MCVTCKVWLGYGEGDDHVPGLFVLCENICVLYMANIIFVSHHYIIIRSACDIVHVLCMPTFVSMNVPIY